jgi:hypothetical protein
VPVRVCTSKVLTVAAPFSQQVVTLVCRKSDETSVSVVQDPAGVKHLKSCFRQLFAKTPVHRGLADTVLGRAFTMTTRETANNVVLCMAASSDLHANAMGADPPRRRPRLPLPPAQACYSSTTPVTRK